MFHVHLVVNVKKKSLPHLSVSNKKKSKIGNTTLDGSGFQIGGSYIIYIMKVCFEFDARPVSSPSFLYFDFFNFIYFNDAPQVKLFIFYQVDSTRSCISKFKKITTFS